MCPWQAAASSSPFGRDSIACIAKPFAAWSTELLWPNGKVNILSEATLLVTYRCVCSGFAGHSAGSRQLWLLSPCFSAFFLIDSTDQLATWKRFWAKPPVVSFTICFWTSGASAILYYIEFSLFLEVFFFALHWFCLWVIVSTNHVILAQFSCPCVIESLIQGNFDYTHTIHWMFQSNVSHFYVLHLLKIWGFL